MAKKQTRKSISVSGNCYRSVKEHCDRIGQSMSSFVEDLIEEKFRTQAPVGKTASTEQREYAR